MRFSFPAFLVFCIVAILFFNESGLSQQLSDELHSKLNDADQKKLTKLDETNIKGDLILSNAGYPGDENLLNSTEPDSKLNKKYFTRRIEATDYYRASNSGKLAIYDRNIKEFWKKYTGEHYKLENVKKAETEASLQFQEAQQFRKEAGKYTKLKEWIPLILKAEAYEKNALLTFQKVLFVYLTYPAQYNETWFATDTITKKKEAEKIATPVKTTVVVPAKTDSTVNKPKISPEIAADKKIAKPEILIAGDSSLYSLIKVDESQIDTFNQFLQKKYPENYENYIINFASLDYSNIESIRNAWYQYKFGILQDSTQYYAAKGKDASPSDTAKQLIAQEISPIDNKRNDNTQQSLASVKKTEKFTTKTSELVKNTTEDKSVARSDVSKPDNKNSKLTKTETTKTQTIDAFNTEIKSIDKSVLESAAKGFLFKIQIVACRASLNENILSGIYSGTEEINETSEDNWYKYTIGNFNTFSEARQLRDQLNVPGAFVVAYLNGKRIRITSSASQNQLVDASLPADIQPEHIQFRLQIGASRNELSADVLKSIYSGNSQIVSVYENNWYKYSIIAGNTLNDALELLKSVDVPGAFVVAYYNNQRINLLSAIRLTKNNQ